MARAVARVLVGLLGLLTAAAGCGKEDNARAPAVPPPRLSAADLDHTAVTAVLDHPIEEGRSVLWCCTFQLAWNQFNEIFAPGIPEAGTPALVRKLNAGTVTAADMPEGSYVAVAGRTGGDFESRLQAALAEAFGEGAGLRLVQLLADQPKGLPAAYAAMTRQLAFEWAFTRYDRPFAFGGRELESFGIDQFDSVQEDESLMARQVVIHDYTDSGEFIVELKTMSEADHLLLARVAPQQTLAATVAAVRRRVAQSQPQKLEEEGNLRVPVIDFDLVRNYAEVEAVGFILARQRTRFRLDETGARLESEAMKAAGTLGQHLIFDAPFLVLLERRGAANPYFALWVGNAELLVPWHDG